MNEIFIPSVLESDLTLPKIQGFITRLGDKLWEKYCKKKKGKERVECERSLELSKISRQISLIYKRIEECRKKYSKDRFLRDECIERAKDKIEELKDKYDELKQTQREEK